MLTDVGAQASAASGKRLHFLNMRKARAGVVVDVDVRILKLNGDEIRSNRVIRDARITVEIPIPFGLHDTTRAVVCLTPNLSCKRMKPIWWRSRHINSPHVSFTTAGAGNPAARGIVYFKPSFFPAANSASDSRIRLSRVSGRLAV